MTVVGIDPSLTGTGIALPSGEVSTVGSRPGAGSTIASRLLRLHQIVDGVFGALEEHDHIDLVVIEAPSLGQSRQGGTLDRNGLWWLLVEALASWSWPIVTVAPATLKKFATGKGNATKADMRMALYQRAGLDVRDDNQVDAWWLRELGHHLLGEPTVTLPKSHTSALEKVTHPTITTEETQ